MRPSLLPFSVLFLYRTFVRLRRKEREISRRFIDLSQPVDFIDRLREFQRNSPL